MVFSSNIFLFVFLPAALLFYYLSPRGVKFLTLTVLSYVFYAWSDPRFVLLLLWVTVVDYGVGHAIYRARSAGVRKVLVGLSLANSLSLLFFFKYAVMAHQVWTAAVGSGGASVLSIVLPAGISFYTFESISYVVDIYRGVAVPARNLVGFACYLAQFPHLVAGPIIRYQELAPQLERPETSVEKFGRGTFFL